MTCTTGHVTILLISAEGVDYLIENENIRFDSYLSTYGHLTTEQVTQFATDPPHVRECVNITIIDDDVVEQVKNKVFVVNFTSNSLIRDRLVIESVVTVTIHDNDRKWKWL